MPNYGTGVQGAPWQPTTNNFMQYNQPQMSTGNNFGQNQLYNQPQMPQSRVMSIAPTSSRENAQQFPVAVNTDLYIINMDAMKLYLKNNPSNPSEMREFDIVEVVKQEPLSDTVTRAEFDEMKSMMSQMMSMMQNSQANQQPHQQQNTRPPKNTYNGGGKRGNRNDQSDGVSTDNG